MTMQTLDQHAFVVEEFSPLRRNTLRGFCRIILPSGMVLSDVAVHVNGDSAWAMPASKPMIGRDGTVLKDDQSRVRYQPIVGFTTKERRDAFSRAVVAALLDAYPGALD